MKALLWSALALLSFGSCNSGPRHPQADLAQQKGIMNMSVQEIVDYATSIDASLGTFKEKSSLVFNITPEESLSVDQYQQDNQQTILYVVYSNSAGVNHLVSKYYLKNDSVLLVSEQQKQIENGLHYFSDRRSYLRNNIVFKIEEKSGPDSASLVGQNFSDKKSPQDKALNPYTEKLVMFRDALNGRNKFDLVFDKLIQLPNASHLLLKGKTRDGYSASILVEEPDLLIDSLKNDPRHFSARKINFKWKVKDHEAIYVPVSANLTSASGLNK